MGHAFAWLEEAMRLFKRAPIGWCILGFITLVSELLLQLVPGIGVAASKVIVPVIECGMLIGAVAVDRGEPLEIRFAIAAFRAPATALAAIVGAALLIFGAETLAGYALGGVNLLSETIDSQLTPSILLSVFAIGTMVSLPLTFVPFAALFEHASVSQAFATSAHGFALNVLPLVLFGGLVLVLIAIGFLTLGAGLVVIVPLLSAATYAAWKDIYLVMPVS